MLLEGYLAIDNIKILLLFLIIGGTSLYIFKDKEKDFLYMINNKNRYKYFVAILINTYLPIVVGIIINFFIKTLILYLLLDRTNKKIYFLVICTAFSYLCIVSIFIGALNILSQLALKEKIKNIIFPFFILNSLIIIFSFGSFIVGETISVLKDFLSLIFYPILKLIDGFFFNFKFELMYFENQIVIMLLIVVMSALTLLLSYKIIIELSNEDLELEFRSEVVRKFVFIMCILLITFGVIVAPICFISLLFNKIKLKSAAIIGEVIFIVLVPIVYIKLNNIYNLRKNNILSNDKEKTLTIEEETNIINNDIKNYN